ncbi:MAG: apolipoprotein N-acyltransferase [Bacteriovoracaceae bacterium]|nr:apolipoprotein N-acyltransferase [Bacteriovoracaceae bacterium]
MNFYIRIIFAGFLFSASFPNGISKLGIPFLVIAAQIILWSVWNDEQYPLKKKWTATFLFNFIFGLVSFYWIPDTLKDFGPMSLWVAWPLFFLFAPFIQFQNFFISFIIQITQSKKYPTFQKLNSPLILASLATATEWMNVRQFPVNLGHAWMGWGYSLPAASFFGESFYSFCLYGPIFLFTAKKIQNSHSSNLTLKVLFIFILCLDYGVSFVNSWPKAFPVSKKENNVQDPRLNVRLVQANIGNFLKISAENGSDNSVESVYSEYQKLTLAPIQNSLTKLDLIVWPETAIPDDFNSEMLTQFPSFIPQRMIELFHQNVPGNPEFLIGGYDRGGLELSTNGIKTEYNAALHFTGEGKLQGVYHKRHLIPFGEGLPFPQWMNESIAKFIPGLSFFSQGHQGKILATKNNFHFITPICYEILFTEFIRDFLNNTKQVDFMINLTNDSWYGDTAEPWQHLMLAKWRVVEFRIPLLRSTNTGITSVIDVDGGQSLQIGVNEKNVLDLSLTMPKRGPTLYQRLGKIPLLIFMMILCSFFALLMRTQAKSLPKNNGKPAL